MYYNIIIVLEVESGIKLTFTYGYKGIRESSVNRFDDTQKSLYSRKKCKKKVLKVYYNSYFETKKEFSEFCKSIEK